MAQFTSRPETPEDWGGLPAEPFARDAATDLEPAAASVDLVGIPSGSSTIEIAVPVAVPTEPIDSGASSGPDDEVRARTSAPDDTDS